MQPGSWLAIGFGDSINSDDPNNIDMIRFVGWECDCEFGPWEEFVKDMHRVDSVEEGWDEANVYFEDDEAMSDVRPLVEDFTETGLDGGYHATYITAFRPF